MNVVVAEFPGPLFALAALCAEDFEALLNRIGATADVTPITSFGQVIDHNRSICLRLPSGRFAALSKRDSQLEFEIALQRVGRAFYERELALVFEFAGIADPSSVERYCNPPFRFVPHPPGDKDLKYWKRFVGTTYPYDIASGA